MRARWHPGLGLAIVAALLSGCGSNTDITRTDDDVDEWVAGQKAAEQDRRAGHSALGPRPATTAAPTPAAPEPTPARLEPCSRTWYERVEHELGVLDAEGHGPDLGSAEWKSAVEHKLGVQDDESFPPLGTPDWCDRVDQRVLQAR